MIRKSLVESTKTEKPLNDFKVVWENFKKYKEATLGEAATYRDACKLREAVKAANEKGIFLKEAEIPTNKPQLKEAEVPGAPAPDAGAPAPAPEAAPAAAPEAGVSPDVQQQISALQAALDALKASAGIEVNEFGAAPTSDIPAVTGQNPEGVADAAAAPAPAVDPAQPVMEAFDAIRANGEKIDEAAFKKVMNEKGQALIAECGDRESRIAYRSAKLDVMNEHYKGDLGKAYLTHLGVLQESKDDWDYIPSEEELAKGYASGPAAKEIKPAKTWPTKDIPASETKGLKESEEKKEEEKPAEEKKEEEKKVEEAVETPAEPETKISESEVTNRYVESYFAPKLDFKSLKESMKNGLLG